MTHLSTAQVKQSTQKSPKPSVEDKSDSALMSTLLSKTLERLSLTGTNELKKRDIMQLNNHKMTKQTFLPANHDCSFVHDRKCWHFEAVFAHPATRSVCPFLSWSAPRGGPTQREPHDSLLQPALIQMILNITNFAHRLNLMQQKWGIVFFI